MIRKGDSLKIKPEWSDPGDDSLVWVALEDEDGGRVRIAPIYTNLDFPGNQVVGVEMVQRCE